MYMIHRNWKLYFVHSKLYLFNVHIGNNYVRREFMLYCTLNMQIKWYIHEITPCILHACIIPVNHGFILLFICASVISSAYQLSIYLQPTSTACFTATIHCTSEFMSCQLLPTGVWKHWHSQAVWGIPVRWTVIRTYVCGSGLRNLLKITMITKSIILKFYDSYLC